MNVLKSVTANRSEIDLTETGKDSNPDQRKSSGFSFFGMRSKSKENVIDTNPAEDNTEEVKKLPTLDDKTIDKNKKFAPMENLTDAAKTKPKGSGFARFKRIRDEMFRKKHQTLKEEDAKKGKFFKSKNFNSSSVDCKDVQLLNTQSITEMRNVSMLLHIQQQIIIKEKFGLNRPLFIEITYTVLV